MTTNVTPSTVQPVSSPPRATGKRSRSPYRQSTFGATGSRPLKSAAGSEARRLAAVILEVLAGVQTPTSAAAALGIGVPRYYLLEQRAVAGLVSACEPRRKGPPMNSDRELARLERELAVARRELSRQQALARVAQRALGLKPPSASSPGNGRGKPGSSPATGGSGGGGGKKSRKRRPVARALRAARVLKSDSTIRPAAPEVQSSAGDVPLAGGGNPGAAGTEGPSLETQGAQGG